MTSDPHVKPPQGLAFVLVAPGQPVLHLLGSTASAGGLGRSGDVSSSTSARG